MTDNEIIKALKCCNKNDCDNCHNDFGNCYANLAGCALDLITRQQSEIERLKKIEIETDDFCRRLCRMRMLDGNLISSFEDLQNYIKKEKSEAVKEFAKRAVNELAANYSPKYCHWIDDTIDNLLKEMAGDTE